MMENHGVFVIGEDLFDLLYKAEVVENTARIATLTQMIGNPVEFSHKDPIPYHQWREF